MTRKKPPKGPSKDDAPPPILDAETKRQQQRISKLRDKLRKALDDPEKRAQMVQAIRDVMNSDEK